MINFIKILILSQDAFDEVRRGFLDPNYGYFYLILGSIIVGIIGIIALIVSYIMRKKQDKKIEESAFKRFEDLCREHNLSNREINLLKHIVRAYKVKNLLNTFQNKSRLEAYFDKELLKYERLYDKNSPEVNKIKDMVKHILQQTNYHKPGKGQLLNSSKDLRIGQRIFIFQRGFKSKKPVLGSIIYLDDFYLAAIFYNVPEILDNVDTGSKIEVTFNRESDANYFFSSRVLKISRRTSQKGHAHVVVLKHSDKLYRTQKRRYERLNVSMPVLIYPNAATRKTAAPVAKQETIMTNAVDISQGGICLESKDQLPVDTLIKLDFTLVIDYHGVFGQVVGISKKRDYYNLHIKFVDMAPELRDNIRKYILTRTNSNF